MITNSEVIDDKIAFSTSRMPSANTNLRTNKCLCEGQHNKTCNNSQFHFAKAEIVFAGPKKPIPNAFNLKTQKNKSEL